MLYPLSIWFFCILYIFVASASTLNPPQCGHKVRSLFSLDFFFQYLLEVNTHLKNFPTSQTNWVLLKVHLPKKSKFNSNIRYNDFYTFWNIAYSKIYYSFTVFKLQPLFPNPAKDLAICHIQLLAPSPGGHRKQWSKDTHSVKTG